MYEHLKEMVELNAEGYALKERVMAVVSKEAWDELFDTTMWPVKGVEPGDPSGLVIMVGMRLRREHRRWVDIIYLPSIERYDLITLDRILPNLDETVLERIEGCTELSSLISSWIQRKKSWENQKS